jgi:hypothetical protein
MSLQSCQPGSTVGFPLKLLHNLFDSWAAASSTTEVALKQNTLVNDITVNWGPIQRGAQIKATTSESSFTVTGFSVAADSTTLTIGTAEYRCSEVISITKIQHPMFCKDSNALYEFIQAFQIQNKASNPSSSDIILITRPLVFDATKTDPFWSAIDASVLAKGKPQSVDLDLKSLYAYSTGELLPMVMYQSCLPVQLLNYNASQVKGNIKIQVNVIMAPIYVKATDSGLGLCRNVNTYSLVTTPKRPVDCFPNASSTTVFQFSTGLNTFPTDSKNNYTFLSPNSILSDLSSVVERITIQIPKFLLGKSLSVVSNKIPPYLPGLVEGFEGGSNKTYKCYKIDPTKDIRNDQILVDPTTGESLSQTMADQDINQDPEILAALNGQTPKVSGILPGDIQFILSIIATVLGSILLLSYFWYIKHVIFDLKDLNWGILHTLIFIGLFIALVFFSIFFDKKS